MLILSRCYARCDEMGKVSELHAWRLLCGIKELLRR